MANVNSQNQTLAEVVNETARSVDGFVPEKKAPYVYFNFYDNSSQEIVDFMKEMKESDPGIVGFVENPAHFGQAVQVLAFFGSEEEFDNSDKDANLEIYQKYVGTAGFLNLED